MSRPLMIPIGGSCSNCGTPKDDRQYAHFPNCPFAYGKGDKNYYDKLLKLLNEVNILLENGQERGIDIDQLQQDADKELEILAGNRAEAKRIVREK